MKAIKKYKELIVTATIPLICFALLFIALRFGSKEIAAAIAVFAFPPLLTFLMVYSANCAANEIVERYNHIEEKHEEIK